ncbi:CRIB domain-containing protein RIC10-like isoform X2 [Panicum virgatum]|uniref:CRIB domain-containing protein RIC10-like isoform X2 n=1 Tax=Panicum virgatum TaxID=38727 RepID=UPI0019D683D0|nr:CRIB domain-containing protein RIC10-like isoform X2 [Panicum virgatum]XP_039804132.1 CRIB domain-containing protein RIC10-like isoform X2 [Panicum virgatum]
MVMTIKGIFRGLKIIAQIFIQREHEIEIGYPTDVRHVSHIGFGANGSCPSWMSEFRGAEDVMAAAAGGGASISSDAQSTQTSWASLVSAADLERPAGGVLPPAEVSTTDSSAVRDAAIAGTPSGAARKPTTRPKKARTPSPASRSSSWRSTGSSATACSDSGELLPAGLRAA